MKKDMRHYIAVGRVYGLITNQRFLKIAGAAVCIVAIGAIGSYAIHNTKAAALFASTQAEIGSLTGLAVKVSDSNASGGSAVRFGTSPGSPPAPTISLTASPSAISVGQSATLNWSSNNASSCSANWTSSKATSGSQSVTPTLTATYSISCNGSGGTTSATTTVSVSSSGSSSAPHVSGTSILDSHNNALLLRGTQIQSELNQFWNNGSTVPQVLNPSVFTAIISWKMNTLRLPIAAYDYQKSGYMTILDNVVKQANSAGLYVILGNFEESQAGGGNTLLDQQGLTMWTYLAAHYKNNPMIMYDLINEPNYTDWNTLINGGSGSVGFNQVISAIRATGAQQIIVVQPGTASGGKYGWSNYPGGLKGTNLVFSLHFYPQIAQGNPTTWNSQWGPIKGQYPLYFGEWALLPHPNYPVFCQGVTNQNADAVTGTFLNYMQSINASWTAWSFTTSHLIQDETSFTPTNFQTGAPWSCPNGVGAGMGQAVKVFLATH